MSVTAETCKRLAELGVATVYEASGRRGLIDAPLIPVLPNARAAGPARTVLCGQSDNLMVHAAIERVQPGEVLVLTMPEPAPVALLGELLAVQVRAHGAAGVLVDAAIRDFAPLQQLGLPVWARYVRVRGAAKNTVGELDATVTVGGATIAPGDIIVMDADGAVCVPAGRVDEVLAAAENRERKEDQLRARLLAGELTYDLHGLRAVVAEKQGVGNG